MNSFKKLIGFFIVAILSLSMAQQPVPKNIKSAKNLEIFTSLTESGKRPVLLPGQNVLKDNIYIQTFNKSRIVNMILTLSFPEEFSSSFKVVIGRKGLAGNGDLTTQKIGNEYIIDWNGINGIEKFDAFFY